MSHQIPVVPVLSVQGIEDASLVCMARIIDETREAVAQVDVSSITLKVFDMASAVKSYETTLVVADTVFNALQTDDRWTVDDTGYNFLHVIPPAAFPSGGRTYQCEYFITFASTATGWAIYQNRTHPVFTS